MSTCRISAHVKMSDVLKSSRPSVLGGGDKTCRDGLKILLIDSRLKSRGLSRRRRWAAVRLVATAGEQAVATEVRAHSQ